MPEIQEEVHSLRVLIKTKKSLEEDLLSLITQKKVELCAKIANIYHTLKDDMYGGELLLEKAPPPYQELDYFLHAIAIGIAKKLSTPDEELTGFDITSLKKPEAFDLQLFLNEFNSFNIREFGIYLIEKEGLLHIKLKNKKIKLHKS